MNKILRFSGVSAIALGLFITAVSVFGIYFTYTNVARENIITTPDSSIPSTPVRGPLTLKAQADIIRVHSLKASGGKTYAEMPMNVPRLDTKGNAVLDEKGQPVMIPNAARSLWVTSTALTTALNLALLTYAFSFLALFIGLLSICIGVVFYMLSSRGQ